MVRDMFVWRKSVYENNFKCNQCGAKLFNLKTCRPTDNLVVDADAKTEEEKSYCFCGKCKNVVAKWQEVSADDIDNTNILQGSYSEWLDKKALDIKADIQKKVEERLEKKYQQRIQMYEETIKSREATIKKLKAAGEKERAEHSEQMDKLYKELSHAYSVINKHQTEIEKLLNEEPMVRRIK